MEKSKLPVLLTPFGELELANALSLRVFRKELSSGKAKAARSLFVTDVENGVFAVRPLPATLFDRAKRLTRTRTSHLGTRTLDVLHVAAALLLQADTFFTFDRNQARLAKAEGLLV
jgi:predicted nucleic acid-binding protein